LSESVAIGRVVSVNVGRPRTVEWFGRQVKTAIWKAPVEGPVAVNGVNLVGDEQADLRVHGGYDKAIYCYAVEDYRWWSAELSRTPFRAAALAPGTFGENLTTAGVDLGAVVAGERWSVGTATLEVSEPRLPCFKLGIRMGDSAFVDLFDQAARFGTYLRVIDEGGIVAGDEIVRTGQPTGGIRIGELTQTHHRPTPQVLGRIAASAEVPESWRAMAQRALRRQAAG
jgi:MOSC domain-containing protein YiiM